MAEPEVFLPGFVLRTCSYFSTMEDKKPQLRQSQMLPFKKRNTEAKNDALFTQLNKELSADKPAFTSGIEAWIKQLEERVTDLELYCYEEVGFTICWDNTKCSPRFSPLQREIAIWRRNQMERSPIDLVK